jgi:hypothetical protein
MIAWATTLSTPTPKSIGNVLTSICFGKLTHGKSVLKAGIEPKESWRKKCGSNSKWNGETTPLDIIKAQDLTQDDLHLETIYLYKEFDSVEQKNEAVKEYHIDNLQKEIERLEAIPYGKGI